MKWEISSIMLNYIAKCLMVCVCKLYIYIYENTSIFITEVRKMWKTIHMNDIEWINFWCEERIAMVKDGIKTTI